jgi:hypothetical protein
VVGIYALMSGDEVVYVGQSINLHSRVGQHRKDPAKIFDGYVVLAQCKPGELDRLENDFIHQYHPIFNKTACAHCGYLNSRHRPPRCQWHEDGRRCVGVVRDNGLCVKHLAPLLEKLAWARANYCHECEATSCDCEWRDEAAAESQWVTIKGYLV